MNSILRLIRKAMPASNSAVVVGGLGRCGTTLVHDAIIRSSIRYRRAPAFAVDLAGATFNRSFVYKTHDLPPEHLPDDVKVIYMFGNPMDAAISAHRSFVGCKHYRHVKSPYAAEHHRMFEKDVLLMETHFDRWMQQQKFSFLSIRYESVYDAEVAELLSNYLRVPVKLPTKRSRRATWESHPERQKIQATYRSLAAKVDQAPKVKLWLPESRDRP